MRGLFTGIGVVALTALVAFFTVPGVFQFISGLFDNSDIGSAVGILISLAYIGLVAQLGILLAVLLAAVVNAIFD